MLYNINQLLFLILQILVLCHMLLVSDDDAHVGLRACNLVSSVQ